MTHLILPFCPGFRIALVDESRLDDEVRRFRLYVVRFSKGRHVKTERARRLLARLRPGREAVRTMTRRKRPTMTTRK